MSFRVDLDMFRGPLDLLLYLVRRHEVDITNLPIALITKQFLDHLEVLEQLDVNSVGDFLELASTLMEIKSRLVLPQLESEEESFEDPREELVERLLQYKKYKDVANMLEDRGREFQRSFTRLANDLPRRNMDPADQPIHEVEIWDLVSAFGRVIKSHDAKLPITQVSYDLTPIQTHMGRIHRHLVEDGELAWSSVFEVGMHKSTLIGLFLAILELVRNHRVKADQSEHFGEIWLRPGEGFARQLDESQVDDSQHVAASAGEESG